MVNVLYIVCRYHPNEILISSQADNNNNSGGSECESSEEQQEADIVLNEASQRNDAWDDFNHPRKRRALILRELYRRRNNAATTKIAFETVFASPTTAATEDLAIDEGKQKSDEDGGGNAEDPLDLYRKVHSDELINFFSTAWKEWDSLGETGRDPSCVPISAMLLESDDDDEKNKPRRIPPLIPSNFMLPRDRHPQRSSKNVMGKVGYFCTDTFTPIVSELVEELRIDAGTVSKAVDIAIDQSSSNHHDDGDAANGVVYALCTHPGHHAAFDSFGGYCYVNNAALAARLLQERLVTPTTNSNSSNNFNSNTTTPKIVILDVDYHCGNGTASIFYDDPTVLVVSIHCHPDLEYPFHSGFGDETGGENAQGCTLHLPLMPGADWDTAYGPALTEKARRAIEDFSPDAFVLSLGLDTHLNDPCATRRAGFRLEGNDYDKMGRAVGEIIAECSSLKGGGSAGNRCGKRDASGENKETSSTTRTTKLRSSTIPTVVLQEGGYELNAVPSAAVDVLLGMAATMGGSRDS